MSKLYKNTKTISYYCQDTKCKARISIKYMDITKKEQNEPINNNSIITLNTTHDHDIKYEEHNYVRNYIIKNDYKNKDRNYISNKCKDFLYRYNILKEIAINYPSIGIKGRLLEKYFIDTYGNIPYEYNIIKPEIREKLIDHYKKINKIEKEENIKTEDVINLTKHCNSVSVNFKCYKRRKEKYINLIKNMEYNNEKLVETLKVKFVRKNKIYEKEIYIIQTTEMKNNLSNKNIEQTFVDCTYYAIPNNNNNYKLLIIMGYDKTDKRSKLLLISLIVNENIETFSVIFNYIKTHYQFKPK